MDVIIPAHNEESTITPIVKAAIDSTSVNRIIVVADSCTDRTRSYASQCASGTRGRVIVLSSDAGDKGSAVAAALPYVQTGRAILFDADLINVRSSDFDKLASVTEGVGVGVRGGSVLHGKSIAISPKWSIGGERSIPTSSLYEVELQGAGYRLETRLNKHAHKNGFPMRYVWLSASHRADTDTSTWDAFKHDVKRWKEVIGEAITK